MSVRIDSCPTLAERRDGRAARRVVAAGMAAALAVAFGGAAGGAAEQPPIESPPTTYELLIDGESFLVEANRQTKLESRQKPGVSYRVALRLAPVQHRRLGSFEFDYELPCKLFDDAQTARRGVRLVHELGFTMLLGDLGGPLEGDNRQQALDLLVESVTETFKQMNVAGLEVGKTHQRDFGGVSALGSTIRYRDPQDYGHTSLVYVFWGENLAGTCIVQYLDHDAEDVLPRIRRILESIRPVTAAAGR